MEEQLVLITNKRPKYSYKILNNYFDIKHCDDIFDITVFPNNI